MTHPRTSSSAVLLATTLLLISGCSDSSEKQAVATPEFEADTSYLDDLAEDQGIDSSTPEPVEHAQSTEDRAETEKQYNDEEREWVKEGGSKSTLGKARDKAVDLGSQIQGSTEPENGLANTTFNEEYAQAAGFAWDMPEGWRMAVPAQGRFAEMYIQNQLGNASVSFTKEEGTLIQIRRNLEKSITDTFGGNSKTRTTNTTVSDFPVTYFDLEGTYIDPSGKGNRNGSPFYAIHAAVIELPTTKVLISLWGPQDTVNQSKAKLDAMIKSMYER